FAYYTSLCIQCFLTVFFYCNRNLRDLHSFPTRRSSDLCAARATHPTRSRHADATTRTRGAAAAARPRRVRPSAPATRAASAHSIDRKSTRLNSSHVSISYAVFCLKKKNQHTNRHAKI